MKDLLIVSHCILNHAAKVEQDEAELAGEYKIREELLQLVLKKDVQLFQMPCPEFYHVWVSEMGACKEFNFNIHFTLNNAGRFLNRFYFSCKNMRSMWKNYRIFGDCFGRRQSELWISSYL